MSTAPETTTQQPEMSDADRAAHEAASYVRRPEPTPDLPKLPSNPAARRRALAVRGWLVAASVAAALALTACSPAQGPAGTVVDKDRTYWSATKQWTYKLTTRDASGATHKFKVSHSDYNACYRGSQYPKCTEVR